MCPLFSTRRKTDGQTTPFGGTTPTSYPLGKFLSSRIYANFFSKCKYCFFSTKNTISCINKKDTHPRVSLPFPYPLMRLCTARSQAGVRGIGWTFQVYCARREVIVAPPFPSGFPPATRSKFAPRKVRDLLYSSYKNFGVRTRLFQAEGTTH